MSPLTYSFAYSAERVGRANHETLAPDATVTSANRDEADNTAEKPSPPDLS